MLEYELRFREMLPIIEIYANAAYVLSIKSQLKEKNTCMLLSNFRSQWLLWIFFSLLSYPSLVATSTAQ